MEIKNPKELFVLMLSDLRQHEERMTKIFQELIRLAEDPDIKEALESRVSLENQILGSLDRCFKLIGEKPVKLTGRLHDIFVEDLHRELDEIKSPVARALYILAKAKHLAHFHMGEYSVLIAMADITGHYGVGTLLEASLADKQAFAERTRRRIRNMIESRIEEAAAVGGRSEK